MGYQHIIDRLECGINSNTKILVLDGYVGKYMSYLATKYDPYMYIIEPIPAFYEELKNNFQNNPKIKLLNLGVSDKKYEDYLYINNDGTTKYKSNNNKVVCKFDTIYGIMDSFSLLNTDIDILYCNCEGGEYPALQELIDTKLLFNFKRIQIQFHNYGKEFVKMRDILRSEFIKLNFVENFNYEFKWEEWINKSKI
jgi:FkbM family methyltransferase